MPGKRKLFITHAGELAHRLVRSVGRDGLVESFVRSYAAKHDRRGLVAHADVLRDFERTMGREALLVMAAEVRRRLPHTMGGARWETLGPEPAGFAARFYADFLASLCRGLEWRPSEAPEEMRAFERDLAMYRQWNERLVAAGRGGHSPFAERCALLLDPSMMEEARRASVDLEKELLLVAARELARLGRSAPRSPRKSRRATRTARKKAKSARTGKPVRRNKMRRRSPRAGRSRRR